MRRTATGLILACVLFVPIALAETAHYVAGSYDPVTGTTISIQCSESPEAPEVGGICVDIPGTYATLSFHIMDDVWFDQVWWVAKAYDAHGNQCSSYPGQGGGTIPLSPECRRVLIHLDSSATQGTIEFWYY